MRGCWSHSILPGGCVFGDLQDIVEAVYHSHVGHFNRSPSAFCVVLRDDFARLRSSVNKSGAGMRCAQDALRPVEKGQLCDLFQGHSAALCLVLVPACRRRGCGFRPGCQTDSLPDGQRHVFVQVLALLRDRPDEGLPRQNKNQARAFKDSPLCWLPQVCRLGVVELVWIWAAFQQDLT